MVHNLSGCKSVQEMAAHMASEGRVEEAEAILEMNDGVSDLKDMLRPVLEAHLNKVPEGEDEALKMALAVTVEALSELYGEFVCTYSKRKGIAEKTAVVLAVASASGNVLNAFRRKEAALPTDEMMAMVKAKIMGAGR